MELEISDSENEVQLANRQHLFSLLAFLEDKVSDYCEVYNHVLFSLWTTDPVYQVYFLRDSVGVYSAITGLKRENRINSKNETQQVWLVTTWSEDEESRLRVYESIKEINWAADEFVIAGRNKELDPKITALLVNNGRELKLYRTNLFSIDRRAALNIELRAHDEVYIKSLETCHAATVYDYWPYKECTTVESVLSSVIESPSAGVFMKDSHQLVSWMTSRVPNGMSQLHTLEEFRRRGYAVCVTQYLAKRMAQAGYTPYATIFPDNKSSERCFQSVGFEFKSPAYIFAAEFPNSFNKIV